MEMENKRYQERLHFLFADVERLSTSPASDTAAVRAELATIQLRLQQLEAEIQAIECREQEQASSPEAPMAQPELIAAPVAPVRLAPLLYEKERVGFAFVDDELKPVAHASVNLPSSAAMIDLPLLVGGEAIGTVKIEPPDEKKLTTEEISFANTVAQQASLQIQSLRLIESAERARSEAEQATRQYMHQGWESYMDAIHQSERIGYVYDQAEVAPYTETVTPEQGIQKSVSVMDEQVGTLFIQPDPNRPLTVSDMNMVDQVAKQIAQQVENIRLLADAARARAEAEEATRRLTRENWKAYAERHESETLAFAYDTVKVAPLEEQPSFAHDIVIEEQLIVRGESIGQLKVVGLKEVSTGDRDTVNAIARQASLHLETLRLTEELQKRAYELQELDRIKSAFLANMSHELRTPLNSILGFADVMLEELDGPLTDYMNNDLRLIQKNGQHLLHLINDVLDMAKIEAGRMNLNPENFHICEILEEVTSITSTLASEKNISLFIDDASDQETEVYADRTRLRQVMINLVNNSIKFTEKGKIAVKVVPMEGARVLISVKDTGIGIPPDKLDAVFQEFTQVDTSTTRKVGGTGLGLPISRRLVEMHGGRLWAESTGINGEGSTFFVELPLEARITDVIEKQAV
jgi:signal transduction histidine kinase